MSQWSIPSAGRSVSETFRDSRPLLLHRGPATHLLLTFRLVSVPRSSLSSWTTRSRSRMATSSDFRLSESPPEDAAGVAEVIAVKQTRHVTARGHRQRTPHVESRHRQMSPHVTSPPGVTTRCHDTSLPGVTARCHDTSLPGVTATAKFTELVSLRHSLFAPHGR